MLIAWLYTNAYLSKVLSDGHKDLLSVLVVKLLNFKPKALRNVKL